MPADEEPIVTQQLRTAGRKRPPSKNDDRGAEIRDAVVELVARHGYDSVTVDAVAAESGAAKATVYRRWSTKAELVVDAVRGSISMPVEANDTGGVLSDLVMALSDVAEALQRDANFLIALLDASRRHEDVWEIMSTQFHESGRVIDRIPLKRAIARGELSPNCKTLYVDEVAMPVLMHRILWHEPVDAGFVEQLVDGIIAPLLAPHRINGSETGGIQ